MAKKKEIKANKPLIAIIIVVFIAAFVYLFGIMPNVNYDKAVALYNEEKYTEAVEIFETLGSYKNSDEIAYYLDYAVKAYKEKNYTNAIAYLGYIDDYIDITNFKAKLNDLKAKAEAEEEAEETE